MPRQRLGGAVNRDRLALRRLICAVIVQSAKDALRGDQSAIEFLDASGELGESLGLRANAFADWRTCHPHGHRAQRAAVGWQQRLYKRAGVQIDEEGSHDDT